MEKFIRTNCVTSKSNPSLMASAFKVTNVSSEFSRIGLSVAGDSENLSATVTLEVAFLKKWKARGCSEELSRLELSVEVEFVIQKSTVCSPELATSRAGFRKLLKEIMRKKVRKNPKTSWNRRLVGNFLIRKRSASVLICILARGYEIPSLFCFTLLYFQCLCLCSSNTGKKVFNLSEVCINWHLKY